MALFLVTRSTVYAVRMLIQAITLLGEVSNHFTPSGRVSYTVHCRFSGCNFSGLEQKILAFLIVTQQEGIAKGCVLTH